MAVDKEVEQALKKWNALFFKPLAQEDWYKLWAKDQPEILKMKEQLHYGTKRKLQEAQEASVVTDSSLTRKVNRKLSYILDRLDDELSTLELNHLREQMYMLIAISNMIQSNRS